MNFKKVRKSKKSLENKRKKSFFTNFFLIETIANNLFYCYDKEE